MTMLITTKTHSVLVRSGVACLSLRSYIFLQCGERAFSSSRPLFSNLAAKQSKPPLLFLRATATVSQQARCAPAQTYCLQKFVNLCMIDGKKSKSHKIISNTLSRLAVEHGAQHITFLMKAIENVKPLVEVRRIRISGSTQLVPSILSRNRQQSLAIRWIVEAAMLRRNTKKSMSLDQCLVAELIDAFHKIGTVRKKRDDLHKLAESNRGFAHYRWW